MKNLEFGDSDKISVFNPAGDIEHFYSSNYQGLLDTNHRFPFEALRVSGDLEEFVEATKAKLDGSGLSSTYSNQEFFGLGAQYKFIDYEQNKTLMTLEAEFTVPNIPGDNYYLLINTYYIYSNYIGLCLKIDHCFRYANTPYGPQNVKASRIINQRYITVGDLAPLNLLSSVLFKDR